MHILPTKTTTELSYMASAFNLPEKAPACLNFAFVVKVRTNGQRQAKARSTRQGLHTTCSHRLTFPGKSTHV